MPALIKKIPLILQLALHSKEIPTKAIPQIMAQWQKLRAENPVADMLDLLKTYPGMTEEKIKKLNTAHKIWLHRNLEKYFGEMALQLGWIKQEHLDEALETQKIIQRQHTKVLDIGDILVLKGFLNQKQQEAILKNLKKSLPADAQSPTHKEAN